ncbi:MAG TPA: NAD(P)H-dependent oxidoreductase subunit E [Gammaproteobacteria bacterium]|nr:NAD(P)H-dependent oxidoreductase subunit E [Gammaproteobacteria bacterium]
MTENKNIQLSPAIRERINQWILRYPPEQKRSGVFEALRLAQEENDGSLTVPLMDAVADYLDMPKIAVYEIATFYTMYYLNPVGRHVIQLCTNISCMLNGSEKILKHLKKRLGIDVNETTVDGQFTLKEVECLGACIAPPVCQIGKCYYENLTPEKIDRLLQELHDGK